MKPVWLLFACYLVALVIGVLLSAVFGLPHATPFVMGGAAMFMLGVVLAFDVRGAAQASARSLNSPRLRVRRRFAATPGTQRVTGVILAIFAVVFAVVAVRRGG